MNRIFKAVVLSVAALATVATTVEIASAGDRHWRKHHAKPWKKRVIIGGVAAGVVAGAVVVNRPRIVYRQRPVVVDEAPIYDREAIYDDETVYADPDEDYGRRTYRDDMPEDEQYAAPSYDDDDAPLYDQERNAGIDDDYFPERPQPRVERKRTETVERKRAAPVKNTETKRTPVKRNDTAKRVATDAAGLKPWSKEWKDWCSSRFPSFNPQNGTYLGYDQKRHFCKAG